MRDVVVGDLFARTLGPADAPVSLVFLHGPGLDHTCFLPYVDPLTDDYRLVFYDARLSGRSTRTADAPVDLDVLSDDLAAIIASCVKGRAVAVSHSFAPWVAINAIRRFPTLLAGLVMVTPGLSLTIGQTLLAHAAAHGTPAQQALLAKTFALQITSDDEFGSAWHELMPLYLAKPEGDLGERLLAPIRFSAAGFNAFVTNAFGRIDWQSVASASTIPTLVLAGARDWVEGDPAGGSRAVADACGNAEFHLFPDCAHVPFAESPDAFVDVLRDWLQRQPFSA